MKPITPFDNYPPFGNGGSRSAPGDAKYALGFVPADTFPAEWANYFFHGATKGVSDLNSAVYSLWNEMGSILSHYNITPDATDNDQLLECLTKLKAEAALAAWPVGTVYQNKTDSRNPATIFGGGTWAQINDAFLACATAFTAGSASAPTFNGATTGGATTYTLTEANIPQHSHNMVHYHYYDIQHAHTATDSGHLHNYHVVTGGQNAQAGGDFPASYGWENRGVVASEISYANITVSAITPAEGSIRLSTEPKNAQGTNIDNTGTYGYANPTAISIIPKYQAVYTWYRTA